MKRLTPLQVAAIGYPALNVVHVLDHLRQGRVLSIEVYGIGTLGLLSGLLVLFLALRDHPEAPLGAAVFGTAATIGVALVHLAPSWGVFSDSYTILRLDTWSWLSADLLMVSGAALAVTGLSSLLGVSRPLPD